MKNSHLLFNTAIGVKKPENIRNTEAGCPFCAREELTDIIDTDDSIILLKNKYPVLQNAFQTVLIETDECSGELSEYNKDHLVKLITFGIKHWFEMEAGGEYESVLFFKNHGPLSGGTIKHPHMQIVGLYDIDYKEKVSEENFGGLTIHENNGVVFSISTKPSIGFYEFNVIMEDIREYSVFSLYIQKAVHYILNHFPSRSNSYNIFFYHLGSKICAKIVPRFVTTPIYIGYSIPQVPNNLECMKDDVRSKYFD